jgi:hypothetical protein
VTDARFLPTNSLETTLMRAATDPVERPAFLRLLVESPLFVLTPVPDKSKEGVRTAGEGEQLQIVQWRSRDRPVIPIFTSVDWLRQALPAEAGPSGYAAMKGRTLFEMLSGGDTNAVLNPRCPYGKEFLLHEMKQLGSSEPVGRLQREVVKAPREVLLGQPAVYPEQLVEAVRNRLPRQKEVRAAYLAWIHDPASETPPHAVIGLHLEPGTDPENVIPPIGVVANSVLGPGEFVDFVVLGNSGIDDYLKSTRPFYEREPATETTGLLSWFRRK